MCQTDLPKRTMRSHLNALVTLKMVRIELHAKITKIAHVFLLKFKEDEGSLKIK